MGVVSQGVAVVGSRGFLDDDFGEFGHAVDGTVGAVGGAAVVASRWEAEILDHG